MKDYHPIPLPPNHAQMTPGELFQAAKDAGIGRPNTEKVPPKPWTYKELADKITNFYNINKIESEPINETTIKNWARKNSIPKKYRKVFLDVLTPIHRSENAKAWRQAFLECWRYWKPNAEGNTKREKCVKNLRPRDVDTEIPKRTLSETLLDIAQTSTPDCELSDLPRFSANVLRACLPIYLADQVIWKELNSENIAFKLIFNVTRLTVARLLVDHSFERKPIYDKYSEFRWSEFRELLTNSESVLNDTTIQKPEILPIYKDIKSNIAKFCPALSHLAESYFITAWWSELRHDLGTYLRAFGSNIHLSIATKSEIAFRCHHDWIISETERAMFSDTNMTGGEPFSLKDIYVELAAYPKQLREAYTDLAAEEKERVWTKELTKRLLDDRKNFLLIRGGPGSGKSSVLRMAASRVVQDSAHSDLAVVFLPLQRHGPFLDDDQSMIIRGDIPAGFSLNRNGIDIIEMFEHSSFHRLLVVLDGLDELGDSVGQKQQLVNLARIMQIIAQSPLGSQIYFLISSRDHAVSAFGYPENLSDHTCFLAMMRAERVPLRDMYGHSEDSSIDNTIYDQRPLWLERYCRYKFVGFLKNSITAEQMLASYEGLDELSYEPLLIYLLSRLTVEIANINKNVSFPFGIFKFGDPKNLNKSDIYDLIIKTIRIPRHRMKTAFEKPFDQGGLPEKDFRECLSCLAIPAWRNGTGRRATVGDFLSEARKRNLEKQAKRFISYSASSHEDTGWLNLLSVFYYQTFRNKIKNQNEFEFTHKSFASFLVATSIFRQAMELLRYLYENKSSEQYDLFHFWIETVGYGEETDEIYLFLKMEAGRYTREKAPRIIIELGSPGDEILPLPSKNFDDYLLALEIAIERLTQYSFKTDQDKSIPPIAAHKRAVRILFGVFGAFLSTKQVISSETRKPTKINIPYLISEFGDRPGYESIDVLNRDYCSANYISRSLFSLDLSDLDFRGLNLCHSDFSNSNLQDANFDHTLLTLSEFEQADMNGLEIVNANLNYARFFRSENFSMYDCLSISSLFEMCKFKEQNFRGCDFSETRFLNCRFERCIFDRLALNSVEFEGTVFINCTFRLCDFEDLDFDDSSFCEQTFENCTEFKKSI